MVFAGILTRRGAAPTSQPIAPERTKPVLGPRHRVLTEEIPLVEYLADRRQVLFSDAMSVMAGYRINPKALDREDDSGAESLSDRFGDVLEQGIPVHKQNPWVLGMYRHVPSDLMPDRDTVHLIVYRRYTHPKAPPKGLDTCDELDEVCERLERALAQLGLEPRRMDGAMFHSLFAGALNPGHRAGDSAYPGDGDLPIGGAFVRSMAIDEPVLDDQRELWYLDSLPHVTMQMQCLTRVPRPGVISRGCGVLDQLPPGSLFSVHVIFDEPVGDAFDQQSLDEIESGHALRPYRTEIGFMLNAANERRLIERVGQLRVLMVRNGIKLFDPFTQNGRARHGNVPRNLPGGIKPAVEMRASRALRWLTMSDICSVAPIYQ